MPIRMAIIKKSTNNKCWRRCGEKRTLPHCWQECKLIQPLWRTVRDSFKKKKKKNTKLPYDPAIPLLGIHSEKIITEKDTRTPTFIAALFTIARTWKQPRRPSTDAWIKMMWSYTQRNSRFSSVAQSCPSLRPRELQHVRPPCPSPTP